MRISQDDSNRNELKLESESITNQRNLIKNYIRSNESFNNCKVYEFLDDGFSGINFERPGFKNLMEQIKLGKINCVIVKDFSRFGRNYIDVGNYIEQVFPFLGVRFISINDDYDSDTCNGLSNNSNIAMKNMIYDFYSKDLSVKISTSKRNCLKKGLYVGGGIPYGLKKDPNQKNKLIIDEEAAVIVRRIFKLALEGIEIGKIATMLNNENILTPAQYYLKKNPNSKRYKHFNTIPYWSRYIIRDIIQQEMYYGAMCELKRQSIMACSKKKKRIPKNERIIVENTHEAIISKEEWIKAQESLGKCTSRSQVDGKKEYLFKGGIVKCGYCGKTLSYVPTKKESYFQCSYKNVTKLNCSKAKVLLSDLEEVIWDTLKKLFANIDEIEKKIQKNKSLNMERNIIDNINILKQDLEEQESLLFMLTEQLNDALISKESFLKRKAEIKLEIEEIYNNIELLEKKNLVNIQNAGTEVWIDNIKKYFTQEKLSQEMIETFIEKIIVFDNQHFEIKWKFSNEFFLEE